MATTDVLISDLKRLEPILRQEGVSGLTIFGSRARGDNHVDLLIDVAAGERFIHSEYSWR